uniref:Uncharacterized protein n=1 Tax=Globisporangium ultimum (strain ATCC 200006 / CBS 805.95 / DAOM BR144) TaxID=431595 RepID=K3WLL6_GLOUD
MDPNGAGTALPGDDGIARDPAHAAISSISGAQEIPTSSTLPCSPKRHGIRRRREESFEIEELDSETMRQNSYNYFQRYAHTGSGAAAVPAYNNSSSPTSHNSNPAFAFTANGAGARLGSSSRKRQRTLADRLEKLCLSGSKENAFRRNTSSSSRSRTAQYAMGDESANFNMMDGDDDEREDDRAASRGELLVYGGVPSMKGFFFHSSRRKPMDRVFRHYATVANQAASAGEVTGSELVVFRRPRPSPPPSPYVVNVPYFSFSPQELEALTRQEQNKRMASSSASQRHQDGESDKLKGVATGSYRSPPRSRSASASSTNSPPFRALGVPRTDSMEDFDDDIDMDDADREPPRAPHASGEISHAEWFLSDGDDDDL